MDKSSAIFALLVLGASNIISPTVLASEKLKQEILPVSQVGSASAQKAYAAAKRCESILKKLFCYTGDDVTDKHQSLFDCFTNDLYSGDTLHEQEVFFVDRLRLTGCSFAELKEKYDLRFGKLYPFGNTPSQAYLRYKKKGAAPI